MNSENTDRAAESLALWERIVRSENVQPVEDLRAAEGFRDELVPHLMAAVAAADADPEKFIEPGRSNGFEFALLLLAQFRATEAFPLVVKMFARHDGFQDELTGDMMTMDGPAILASLYDGDFVRLKSLAEDRDADEYARGAAVTAVATLLQQDRLPREAVTLWFDELFKQLGLHDETLGSALFDAVRALRLDELRDPALRAFDDLNVDRQFYARDDVGPDREPSEIQPYRVDVDAVRDSRWWGIFQTPNPSETSSDKAHREIVVFDEADFDSGAGGDGGPLVIPFVAPFVREQPKVGRNDPCACGSGLKFKKCCGK